MKKITLDPKTLLGFKIIVEGSAAKLRSPKIGGKQCAVHAAPAAADASDTASALPKA